MLNPNKPTIALTFDDDPVDNPNTAHEILDILEAYHINATFFYCGSSINNSTVEKIKRSYLMGNEIGNHTMHYQDLTKLSDDDIRTEVEDAARLLHNITHLTHFLVRPPYLNYNENLLNIINEPLISASLDSKDCFGIQPHTIIHNVLSQVTDGSIVLMHENQVHTVTALKTLIPSLLSAGYQITTVSNLMAQKNIILSKGRLYTHA